MSTKPIFDESQARLHWQVLGYGSMMTGCCAELRLVGDGPAICLPVQDEDQLIEHLAKNMTPKMLAMLSVNPRNSGFVGAGKTSDVAFVQTIFVDIDVDRAKGTNATPAQLRQLKAFREGVFAEKLKGLGLEQPAVMDSGNGFHTYLAIPEVALAPSPELPGKLNAFCHLLRRELDADLKKVGARIDSTMDPARMAKLAGTAKPGKGNPMSGFVMPAVRTEDSKLLDVVMALDASATESTDRSPKTKVDVAKADLSEENIPDKFLRLVRTDSKIRELWHGKATDIPDTTRSGQDWALIRALIPLGFRDKRELAAILYGAPHQKAQEHSNPVHYIERTLGSAFDAAPPGLVPGAALKGVVGDPDYLNPAQDFRDGLAFFSRAFVVEKLVKVKKGKEEKSKLIKAEVTKIITSDRCALIIEPPLKIPGLATLAEVWGSTYQVKKVQLEGAGRWRLSGSPYSLDSFLAGKAPAVDLRTLLPTLEGRFREYIYFPDDGDHLLCALYVMLSYFYRLFSGVPYIHLHGAKGSAKTTAGRLFACIGFNGTMTSNCSAASLFRTLDRLSPLFVLDETEGMYTRADAANDPRTDLLKGGYQRGAVVTRQDSDNINVTRAFDVYSPKVICNIFGLDDVLADRAIRIQTRRATKKEAEALARSQPDITNPRWATYRDMLYCLAMQRHLDVARIRDETESDDIGFIGRDYELWFPLFVLAALCEESRVPGVVARLRDLAERKRKAKESARVEGDEERLVRILLELIDRKGGGEVEVTMTQLALIEQEETGEKASPKVLGRRLRTIGVSESERRTITDAAGDQYTTRVYTVSRKGLGQADE